MKIDFASTADIWLEARCYQSPSALHGWLSGYLASGSRLTHKQWLTEATDYLELEASPEPPLSDMLPEFYDWVLAVISAEEMAYSPLLPSDEDADVAEQVECLAEWSKGFLDGFGASERSAGQLPEDVVEVLRDLDAFSQAQVDDLDDAGNEGMYLDLSEHARVAALTVFYNMNRSAGSSSTTLH
tara:strand:- start:1058 stop:1612 length:555 start_codon:yes stop_codon:yes gene_type:complete